MSDKELTYVLDEEPVEDDTVVGYMSIPCSLRHIAAGYLPITAADLAKIELRASRAETENEVAQLRVQLLGQLCKEMAAAIRDGQITRDSLSI